MTDITAELAALPKMPKPSVGDNTRELLAEVRALKAYLAIAERALQNAVDGWTNDARAYLAHRAKEQQT